MDIRAFFGFLLPRLRYRKDVSSIEDAGLPERVVLLGLHKGGDPVEVLSGPGDAVKTGQAVMRTVSGTVYSTVTGVVESLGAIDWTEGERYRSVTVKVSGADDFERLFAPLSDVSGAGRDDLLSKLDEAGFDVSCLSAGSDVVIVSLIEDDLLVSVNRAVAGAEKEKLSQALGMLKAAAGAGEVLVAVPRGEESLADGLGSVTVCPVKPVHPAGMGEVLVRGVLGRKDERSAVVVGAAEAVSMVSALQSGRPVYETVLTLIGEGSAVAGNFRVRVGTPVSEVLRGQGMTIGDDYRVVLGGPLRGRSVYDPGFPVMPGTSALLVQGSGEIIELSTVSCLNCGRCVQVCPRRLPVNLLSRYSEHALFETCEELDIDYCIECGLCSYVCQARRPVMQFMQFAKREIAKRGEGETDDGE
jgi:electron transport complex protein RnfC